MKVIGPIGQIYLGRTGLTNAVGDTPGPLAWSIPLDASNGLYNLTSHPAVNPPNLNSNTQIASFVNLELDTPFIYLSLILK